MLEQSKTLPTRDDINSYFFSGLELMGKWGWGSHEAIIILYLAPAMIFTLGWALGEVWTPFGLHWRPILAGLFFFHLLTGIALFLRLSKGARSLPRERLQRRALISLAHLFAGYVWIIGYTIYTNAIVFHTDRPLLGQIKSYSVARTVYCLIILTYINIVFLLYRKVPAYRLEGALGVIELLLWTGLISLTGSFQSQFLYLYFLTLSPAFRRGVPEIESIRYPTRANEPLWSVIYRKHNRMWTGAVLYPFFWLAGAVAVGAFIYMVIGTRGSYQPVTLHASWPISYLIVLGHFYLNCAPWLLLSIVMAVTVQIETDRLRTLGELMEIRANANWNEDLREVVAELALAIENNSTFRSSGVLATTVVVSRTSTKNRSHEVREYAFGRAFQRDNIRSNRRRQVVDEVELFLKYCPLDNGRNSILRHLDPVENTDVGTSFGIVSDYFYYLDNPIDKARFRALIDPLEIKTETGNRFWHNARSLCYVVIPHPRRGSADRSSSYTIVFFKSDLPGEYDRAGTKLYEALSAQVIGILLKHELYMGESARAQRESDRANIGAGMFHNLAHYILPLKEYGHSLVLFIRQKSFDSAEETALSIEGTINRLAQFQSAVLRYIKHRESYEKTECQSLRDVPSEALMIQTRAIHAAIRGLSRQYKSGVGEKYVMILRNLCPGGERLNISIDEEREQLQFLIVERELASLPIPECTNSTEWIKWWDDRFGLRIKVNGDFDALRGNGPITIGVVEELLLNAIAATSKVLCAVRLSGSNGVDPFGAHITIEAAPPEGNNAATIYIKNYSLEPLSGELFDEPRGDKGWGLFAMRLLMEKAGGRLQIWNDGEGDKQRGKRVLEVGFQLALNGGEANGSSRS